MSSQLLAGKNRYHKVEICVCVCVCVCVHTPHTYLRNSELGLEWHSVGQHVNCTMTKPFLKHLQEKLSPNRYKYFSQTGEETSIVKLMYLAIIDIKYLTYLMQFCNFTFIRQTFIVICLPAKVSQTEKIFIMSLLSLVVCVARMFYCKEIH